MQHRGSGLVNRHPGGVQWRQQGCQTPQQQANRLRFEVSRLGAEAQLHKALQERLPQGQAVQGRSFAESVPHETAEVDPDALVTAFDPGIHARVLEGGKQAARQVGFCKGPEKALEGRCRDVVFCVGHIRQPAAAFIQVKCEGAAFVESRLVQDGHLVGAEVLVRVFEIVHPRRHINGRAVRRRQTRPVSQDIRRQGIAGLQVHAATQDGVGVEAQYRFDGGVLHPFLQGLQVIEGRCRFEREIGRTGWFVTPGDVDAGGNPVLQPVVRQALTQGAHVVEER